MHVLRNEFGYTKTKLRTKIQKPSMSKEMRSPGFVSRIKVVVDTHLLCGQSSYKDVVVNIKYTTTFILLTKFQNRSCASMISLNQHLGW